MLRDIIANVSCQKTQLGRLNILPWRVYSVFSKDDFDGVIILVHTVLQSEIFSMFKINTKLAN